MSGEARIIPNGICMSVQRIWAPTVAPGGSPPTPKPSPPSCQFYLNVTGVHVKNRGDAKQQPVPMKGSTYDDGPLLLPKVCAVLYTAEV